MMFIPNACTFVINQACCSNISYCSLKGRFSRGLDEASRISYVCEIKKINHYHTCRGNEISGAEIVKISTNIDSSKLPAGLPRITTSRWNSHQKCQRNICSVIGQRASVSVMSRVSSPMVYAFNCG